MTTKALSGRECTHSLLIVFCRKCRHITGKMLSQWPLGCTNVCKPHGIIAIARPSAGRCCRTRTKTCPRHRTARNEFFPCGRKAIISMREKCSWSLEFFREKTKSGSDEDTHGRARARCRRCGHRSRSAAASRAGRKTLTVPQPDGACPRRVMGAARVPTVIFECADCDVAGSRAAGPPHRCWLATELAMVVGRTAAEKVGAFAAIRVGGQCRTPAGCRRPLPGCLLRRWGTALTV